MQGSALAAVQRDQGRLIHAHREHTFLTGGNAYKQSEKYRFSCIEMSRRFLAYGDHALTGFGS